MLTQWSDGTACPLTPPGFCWTLSNGWSGRFKRLRRCLTETPRSDPRSISGRAGRTRAGSGRSQQRQRGRHTRRSDRRGASGPQPAYAGGRGGCYPEASPIALGERDAMNWDDPAVQAVIGRWLNSMSFEPSALFPQPEPYSKQAPHAPSRPHSPLSDTCILDDNGYEWAITPNGRDWRSVKNALDRSYSYRA